MNRKIIYPLIIASILVLASAIAIPLSLLSNRHEKPQKEASFDVWFESPMVRVERDFESNGQESYHLFAAKGEFEPFQIVIKAINETLNNVSVEISDFVAGTKIIASSQNVELFYEHYINVTTPTYKSPFQPKEYPDALIPFFDPITGEDITGARFDGCPFAVNKGECQPIWVDVFVPREAEAGEYNATVVITANATNLVPTAVSLQLFLTVWDFTLPEEVSMRSSFYVRDCATQHYYHFSSSPEDMAEFKLVNDLLREELIRHKLMPVPLHYEPVKPHLNGTPNWQSAEAPAYIESLEHWIDDLKINAIDFFFWSGELFIDPFNTDRDNMLNWIRGYYDFFVDRGWEDLLYVYLGWEPNSEVEYELVRQWADVVHEGNVNIKVLALEQFTPDDPSWETLKGYVDIWCPHWELFNEIEVQERLALGEEVWTYRAMPQDIVPNAPEWEIDFPIINYRLGSWINEHFGATGLLYWGVNYWPYGYDPWEDTITWVAGSRVYNKDGDLLYPGIDAGINGPVTSIRLKMLRESAEDYEYFQLLKAIGKENQTKTLVDSIIPGWSGWTAYYETLMTVRKSIATEILGTNVWKQISLGGSSFPRGTMTGMGLGNQLLTNLISNIHYCRDETFFSQKLLSPVFKSIFSF